MRSKSNWRKVVKTFWRIDHLLLAMYLIALMVLLMFPMTEPDFELLGVASDKWMHFGLFGGLAIFLRWSFAENRHPLLASIGVAIVVAAIVEIAQGQVGYRNPELWDLIAGALGAMAGAATVHLIMVSRLLQRLLGLLVAILGLMVGAFFLMADVIGVGDSTQFGLVQIAGIAVGALIAMGGVKVYSMLSRVGKRLD